MRRRKYKYTYSKMAKRKPYRDYHTRPYKGNPYSTGRKRKGYFSSWRNKLGLLALLAVLTAWAWLILYSPYLEIKNIKIYGTKEIPVNAVETLVQSQLNSPRYLIFKQKNIFLFDEVKLEQRIRESFKLEDVKLEKKLWDTLRIQIYENKAVLVYQEGEHYYNVDKKGIVLKEIKLKGIEEGLIPIEKYIEPPQEPEPAEGEEKTTEDEDLEGDETGDSPEAEEIEEVEVPPIPIKLWQDEEQILSEEMTQFIMQTNIELKDNNLPITTFAIPDFEGREVRILMTEGWQAYLDIDDDPEDQIKHLDLVLKQKIKTDREHLDYVDLRFGERVVYKLR